MLKKFCPKCHQNSYSISERDTWICPTCNTDLSTVLPLYTENKKRKALSVIKNDQVLQQQITPFVFKSFE